LYLLFFACVCVVKQTKKIINAIDVVFIFIV
jgi:hypothetical protein